MTIFHYRDYNGNALCGRRTLQSTLDKGRVNCPRCKEILKESL